LVEGREGMGWVELRNAIHRKDAKKRQRYAKNKMNKISKKMIRMNKMGKMMILDNFFALYME